jgi:outer membrane protein assembly factor BamB
MISTTMRTFLKVSWQVICCFMLISCVSSGKKLQFPIENSAFLNQKTIAKTQFHKTQNFEAQISYISVNSAGNEVLVSTSFERENKSSLRLFSLDGKKLWKKSIDLPAKSQAFSADGKHILLNTYSAEIYSYSLSGKLEWKKEGLGKLLSFNDNVFLINDDDADPKHPFFRYSLKGELLQTYEINRKKPIEFSDVFLNPNKDQIWVTFSDGSLDIIDFNNHFLFKTENPFKGFKTIFSMIISDQLSGVWILGLKTKELDYMKVKPSLEFIPFKKENSAIHFSEAKWSLELPTYFETLHGNESMLYLYSNHTLGQKVIGINSQNGTFVWENSIKSNAIYSSVPMLSSVKNKSIYTVGLSSESFGIKDGEMGLFSFSENGDLYWKTEIPAPSGIFSFSLHDSKPFAIIGAGDPNEGVVHFIKF